LARPPCEKRMLAVTSFARRKPEYFVRLRVYLIRFTQLK
jgi:hypothetical protein